MNNETDNETPGAADPGRKRGCLFYGAIVTLVLVTVITVTILGTTWWVRRQVHAKPLEPVELSAKEQQAVEAKLEIFSSAETGAPEVDEDGDLVRRSLAMTEREINGLLNSNTEFGDRLYIYLHPNAISAKANIPIEEDAPMFAGKTLRVKIKFHVRLAEEQLTVKVKDVVFCGFPLPAAWLGGLKNADLVTAYFGEDPAISNFVQGIEHFAISEDKLELVLAE